MSYTKNASNVIENSLARKSVLQFLTNPLEMTLFLMSAMILIITGLC